MKSIVQLASFGIVICFIILFLAFFTMPSEAETILSNYRTVNRNISSNRAITREQRQAMIAEIQRDKEILNEGFGGEKTYTRVAGDTIAHAIWNRLDEEGFTDAAKAAMLGVINQECSFNIFKLAGSYWGMFQWGGGREIAPMQALIDAGFEPLNNPGQFQTNSKALEHLNGNQEALNAAALVLLNAAFQDTGRNGVFGIHWSDMIRDATCPEIAAEMFQVAYLGSLGLTRPDIYETKFQKLVHFTPEHPFWQANANNYYRTKVTDVWQVSARYRWSARLAYEMMTGREPESPIHPLTEELRDKHPLTIPFNGS